MAIYTPATGQLIVTAGSAQEDTIRWATATYKFARVINGGTAGQHLIVSGNGWVAGAPTAVAPFTGDHLEHFVPAGGTADIALSPQTGAWASVLRVFCITGTPIYAVYGLGDRG
jgi:hypothetical protein